MKSHDFVGGITAIDTNSGRAILPLEGENKLLSTNASELKWISVYLSHKSLEDCLLPFHFSNYIDLSPLLCPTKLLFRRGSSDCVLLQGCELVPQRSMIC